MQEVMLKQEEIENIIIDDEKKDEKKRNKIKQFKTPGKEAHSIMGCLCSADCTICKPCR